jgi:hypothetical protein
MLKNKLQAVAVLGEQSKAAVRSLKQILKQHQKEIKTFKHQVLIFVKKKSHQYLRTGLKTIIGIGLKHQLC